MVKNNKLLETLYKCVKGNGACSGCFYGEGYDQPQCMLHLMNDLLFFFKNPVPSSEAKILSLDELEEALSDHKDHLAFAEFISTIHVAQPVIRTISMKGNFVTLHDPQTNETDTFSKQDYYIQFRVWSTKPTDTLRNATKWESRDGMDEDDTPTKKSTKTTDLLNFISKMT